MNIENIMLSEGPQGPHIIWFHSYEMSQTGKSIETQEY